MELNRIIGALRELADESLAESWDNVGLLLGDPAQDVRHAVLCIDLTEAVLHEAVAAGAQLIVAYHPPIFKPLSRITTSHWKQRIILEAARAGVAIYSPHTALDAAEGGVNDWLLSCLDVVEVVPLKPAVEPRLKLVTFVPEAHLAAVRQALAAAGAGQIGAYSECSFSMLGEGTFRGDASTHPAVGEAGRFETVAERRLEMLVPRRRLSEVVSALKQAHPYEEVAYDLVPLELGEASRQGAGRAGRLRQPMLAGDVAERFGEHLGLDEPRMTLHLPSASHRVTWVGVCPGAGGGLLWERPVDLFLTGEMRHHDVLDAVSSGVAVVLGGHTQTERPYLPTYCDRIVARLDDAVQWTISTKDEV